MSFAVTVSRATQADGYLVRVKVRLSGSESSRLFLAGDTLLSWPAGEPLVDGSIPPTAGGDRYADIVRERTSMFVSEAAGLAQGLQIRYLQAAHADRAARLLRSQLLEAGIEEEE